MIVTVDPGIATGWALWEEGIMTLADCGLGDPRSSTRHKIADVSCVWIESPTIYPRSKAKPNDIVKLAIKAGYWWGIYDQFAVDVHLVEPRTWKGQVPKTVHHKRVMGKLASFEKTIIEVFFRSGKIAPGDRHNVLDAVALGVWVRESAK